VLISAYLCIKTKMLVSGTKKSSSYQITTLMIYRQQFLQSDWLRTCQLITNQCKKVKLSAKRWNWVQKVKLNIGTQGVQELFLFCEVSEIGAFMELFTVMIWLIWQWCFLPPVWSLRRFTAISVNLEEPVCSLYIYYIEGAICCIEGANRFLQN